MIISGNKIVLNEAEKMLAISIARERTFQNRKNGIADRKFSKRPAEEIELDGIAAELCFCKKFNLYPDMSTHIRKGGADAITKAGNRVDVKSSQGKSRLVISGTKTGEDTDVFALMSGQFPAFEFMGWCYAADVLTDQYAAEMNGRKVYSIPVEELN